MKSCDEYATKTLRYLDHDLQGVELKDFLTHLHSCDSCRAHVVAEKELSATLHRSRPLYSVPAALRARVSAAVEQATPPSTAGRSRRHSFHALVSVVQRFLSLRVLAPAVVAVALCLTFVPNIVRNVRAASYVQAAVAEHRSYLRGDLPLGLQSSSPELVTAWFAHKLPFDFRLPVADARPEGKPTYQLTGAALVSYRGKPTAFVTYATKKEKISLMVASNSSAEVAGGDQVRFGELTFHYYNDSGLRVITWSNHGLSYALVSSVSGPARASCLVCHQNMSDSSNFKVHQ
jgi:hypothetical protein